MAHKIEDFGEKIGGAKKDLWKSRGMVISDLDDINDMEIETMVCKENIWATPDWSNYIVGVDPRVLYYIRYVREKLPSKLDKKHANRRYAETFVRTIREVREFCENDLKDFDKCRYFFMDFCEKYGYLKPESRAYSEKAYDNTIFSSNWVKSVQLSSYSLNHLASECRIQNFPQEFRGDLKGTYIMRITRGGKEQFILRKGSTYSSLSDNLCFDTEDEAYKYARTEYIDKLNKDKEVKTVTRKGTIKVVRPQLTHITRTGGDIREGHDCTPEIMLEDFGFRGGEFGNWNNDNDRQACLNYAFDAFCDLALALDIPLKGVSL